MSRVLITPANPTHKPFELEGELTYRDFKDYGRHFYIKGSSYPAGIVTILDGEAAPENGRSEA